MEKPIINLLWLYPDLLNLHGERGSVQAFVRAGENLGVQINVKRVEDFNDKIDFDSADLIMLLPGELKELQFIKPALEKQEKELLQKTLLLPCRSQCRCRLSCGEIPVSDFFVQYKLNHRDHTQNQYSF